MTSLDYFLLFLAGAGAGFIDSIAGGGGLISVPVLLAVGLPPQAALATNKMQSTWGTLLAVVRYIKAGLVRWQEMRIAIVATFISALLGTWAVTQASNESLKAIIPWMLLAIALYTLFSPRLGQQEKHARLSPALFGLLGGGVLGFYDGFFGPGTGSFWTIACIALIGLGLQRATAYTKVVNLTSNAASLLVFLGTGWIRYDVALVMIGGQLIGARLGSGLVIRHGAVFIRIVFLSVVLALVTKLLWEQLA